MPESKPKRFIQYAGGYKNGRTFLSQLRHLPIDSLAGLGEVRDGKPGELEPDNGAEPFAIDPNIFEKEKNEVGTKNNPGEFDCYAAADPNEPMFILLGRDPIAPTLVRDWANARVRTGRNNTPDEKRKIAEARQCADAMETYHRERATNGK